MSVSLTRSTPLLRLRLLIVMFILAIAAFSTLPNYITGQWAWTQAPQLEHTQALRQMQEQGLSLPGWQTLEQREVNIGGHSWSVQAIVPEAQAETATLQSAVWLFLRPQVWERDLPQVDWMDLNGAQQWTADSVRKVRFPVPIDQTQEQKQSNRRVEARFLRGWNRVRTYAVLQWYAWKDGGSAAPSQWFWADQIAQLYDRQRMPWVAVSLMLPIQPLGNIEPALPQLEAIGQQVQSALIKAIFPAPDAP